MRENLSISTRRKTLWVVSTDDWAHQPSLVLTLTTSASLAVLVCRMENFVRCVSSHGMREKRKKTKQKIFLSTIVGVNVVSIIVGAKENKKCFSAGLQDSVRNNGVSSSDSLTCGQRV